MNIELFEEKFNISVEDSWVCSNEFDHYFKEMDERYVICDMGSIIFAIQRRFKNSSIDENCKIKALDLISLEVEVVEIKRNELFINQFFKYNKDFLEDEKR